MKQFRKPRGKPGRGRAGIEDHAKFVFDRGKPFAKFFNGMDKQKILGALSGRAGKLEPCQAAVENGGRGARHGRFHQQQTALSRKSGRFVRSFT